MNFLGCKNTSTANTSQSTHGHKVTPTKVSSTATPTVSWKYLVVYDKSGIKYQVSGTHVLTASSRTLAQPPISSRSILPLWLELFITLWWSARVALQNTDLPPVTNRIGQLRADDRSGGQGHTHAAGLLWVGLTYVTLAYKQDYGMFSRLQVYLRHFLAAVSNVRSPRRHNNEITHRSHTMIPHHTETQYSTIQEYLISASRRIVLTSRDRSSVE